MGVPPEKILLEEDSRHTAENFRLGRKLLEERNIPHRTILYMQTPLQQLRTRLTFEKAFEGSGVKGYSYIAPGTVPQADIDFLVGRRTVTIENGTEKENVMVGELEKLSIYDKKDAPDSIPVDIPQSVLDARFWLEMERTAELEGVKLDKDSKIALFIGGPQIIGGYYYKLFEAYTTRPDLQKWWLLIKDLPHVFYENFFFGGFLILPVMFLLVLLLTRRKPSLPEVAVMLGGLFVFLICNAAPPLPPGGWSFRGEGVSRLYQPMFIVWVLYLMRQSLQKNLILALIGVAVIAQASIALGPITIHRSADDLYNRFYKHGHPGTMIDNLTRYGRRPLGFCKPPATPS
jgi:hypothetical protein